MSLYEKRPLATVLSFFLLGSVFFLFLSPLWRIIGVIILLLLSVLVFLLRKRIKKHGLLAFASLFFLFLAGLISFLYFDASRYSLSVHHGKQSTATGCIREILYEDESSIGFSLELLTVNDAKESGLMQISLTTDIPLSEGDYVAVSGIPLLYSGTELLTESILRPTGEGVTCFMKNAVIVQYDPRPPTGIHACFAAMRQSMSMRMQTAVSGEAGALLSTLLLGEWSVTEHTALTFRYTGLLPLLAISGTHFTILTFALVLLLKRLRIGAYKRTVVLILFLIFYTALSGFLPSVVRAAIMLLASLSGYLFGRRYDPLTALLLTASVMLLFSPYLIVNAGFLLSVAATYGILFCGEAIKRSRFDPEKIGHPILHYLYSSLFVTASAVLFTLPISALLHGELSLLSFLGNLCLSPLMSLLLFLSSAVLLFPYQPITFLADALSNLILTLLDLLSSIPCMLLPLSSVCIKLLIIGLLLWFILTLAIRKPEKAHAGRPLLGLLTTLVIYIAVINILPFFSLRYIYRSDKNCDRIILQNGVTSAVVDLSGGNSLSLYSAVSDAVALSATEIHTIYLTDSSLETADVLDAILGTIKVRRICLPIPVSNEEHIFAEAIYRTCLQHKTELLLYRYPAGFRLGEIVLRFYPENGDARLVSIENAAGKLVYMTASYYRGIQHNAALSALENADRLFLGAHASEDARDFPYCIPSTLTEVYISDPLLSKEAATLFPTCRIYLNCRDHIDMLWR